MLKGQRDSIFMGVSELKLDLDKILDGINNKTVIIEKRNKPIAVLMSSKEYEKREALLDMVEDFVLGTMAQERVVKSKDEEVYREFIKRNEK